MVEAKQLKNSWRSFPHFILGVILTFNVVIGFQKTCTDCHFDFCSACIMRFKGSERLQRCRRCRVFFSIPLDRQAVMNLRVRDLLWYLNFQTGSTTQWQADLAPKEIAATDMRNRHHVQLLLTWSTDSSLVQSGGGSAGLAAVTVDDLHSAEQISQLSVRQLKLILTRSYVDYRGCCEKSELRDRVLRLWEQHLQTQDVERIQDENLCKICMEAAIDSVLLECGHMVTCTKCGKHLAECPVCRQYVVRVVHTFQA
ncbi:RNF34 [Cordylochernes scorpioides]|uniref:RNF34 n=1 Tax=Cordylochernes scorpioides TaxID=51811 RepID=A0ABY6LNS2_9ARAC|nr:RNF34 [Cordylochernes scorpioides]